MDSGTTQTPETTQTTATPTTETSGTNAEEEWRPKKRRIEYFINKPPHNLAFCDAEGKIPRLTDEDIKFWFKGNVELELKYRREYKEQQDKERVLENIWRFNNRSMAAFGMEYHICLTCWKDFTNEYSLKQHQRTHQPKEFKCDHCGKTFPGRCNLRQHKRNLLRLYKCDYCDYRAGTKARLREHVDRKVCRHEEQNQ